MKLSQCKAFSLVVLLSISYFISFLIERENPAIDNSFLDITDYPNRIIRPYEHSNGTLLSPEGQDIRWNDYVKYYQDLQAAISQTKLERYVIYTTTYSGLANKINGLISSLLIAMVTNRGFMLYDWRSFDSYFNLSLVNHHYDRNSTMSKGKLLRVWRRCVETDKLTSGFINKRFGTDNINVFTNCPLYTSLAKNDNYYKEFVNRGLVRTAKRGEYSKIIEEISYRLLNFFTLESSLQAKLDSISSEWKNRFVVGMQIRIGIGNSAFSDNCKFLFQKDIDTFITYADYYSKKSNKEPLWFISTDSPDVEFLFKGKYGNKVFMINDLPMKHSKVLAYNYGDPATQRAVLDNYLLSKSDLLLTTGWSSFGEIALGRMDKGTTILITRSDPIKDPPPLVTFDRT